MPLQRPAASKNEGGRRPAPVCTRAVVAAAAAARRDRPRQIPPRGACHGPCRREREGGWVADVFPPASPRSALECRRFAPAVADAPPWLPHRSPSQRTMGFHGVVLTPFSVHALPLPLRPPQSPSIDCCRRPKNRRTEREPSLVSHFFHERAAERDAPQCQTCYARGSGLEPPKIWRPA